MSLIMKIKISRNVGSLNEKLQNKYLFKHLTWDYSACNKQQKLLNIKYDAIFYYWRHDDAIYYVTNNYLKISSVVDK